MIKRDKNNCNKEEKIWKVIQKCQNQYFGLNEFSFRAGSFYCH